MPTLHDGSGRPVAVGQELGRGGEGAVFDVAHDPGLVAKVYHGSVEPQKVAKLRAMARIGDAELFKIAAWPTGTLHDRPGGVLRGILMPKVTGHREIHQLYGPAHRKHYFPAADWSFLIHAAMNCAAAFETVHDHGHVIGDVNQGGVLVSAQGTVRLIDCDSFQVRENGQLYYCVVGVPQYTPPELVGSDFRSTPRTRHHDCFGLALLIFHLLFMGRHPFAGRFSGQGDMTIERAISEGRFAFSRSAASYQMAAPPHSLNMDAVSPRLAGLFERAFARGATTRPLAAEWRAALKDVKDSLQRCTEEAAHVFPRGLASCPWCRLEEAGGPAFFLSAKPLTADFDAGYNFLAAWARIQNLAYPAPMVLAVPPRPRGLRGRPVPDDARVDRAGDVEPLPPAPVRGSEPLPRLPTYAPELKVDEPPFELEPLPPLPEFVPDTVPDDPAFVPEPYPHLAAAALPDPYPALRARYKQSFRSVDYLMIKWFTLASLPWFLLTLYSPGLALAGLVFTGPGAVIWFCLYAARLVEHLERKRAADHEVAHLRAQRLAVERDHERAKQQVDARNTLKREAWEDEVRKLEGARRELPRRNELKRQAWQRDVARVEAARAEIRAGHVRKLQEWQARVEAHEAERVKAWEAQLARVEDERDRARERNVHRHAEWEREMERYRQECQRINAHNEEIARARDRYRTERQRRAEHLRHMEDELERLKQAWNDDQQGALSAARAVLQRLQAASEACNALKRQFDDDRDRMSQQRMEHQLHDFLDNILIEDEQIDGIGPARKATLAAYGIETAADVTDAALAAVPGFGPVFSRRLMTWRIVVERRFSFNPSQAMSQAELRALHAKYQKPRRELQVELAAGEEKLIGIRSELQRRLDRLRDEMAKLILPLAQAEADLGVMPELTYEVRVS